MSIGVVIGKDTNSQAFRNELQLNDLAWKLLYALLKQYILSLFNKIRRIYE